MRCPECGRECIQCEAILNGLDWFEQLRSSAPPGGDALPLPEDDDEVKDE